MKLKEVDRTANVAWSPASSSAIYLAAGTAAQQLDSSFSSNAALELYFFDINQPGLDMPMNASLACESRFHKLVWGSHGIVGSSDADAEHPSGLIVAGCDNGLMQVYDASKILNNDEEPIVLTKNKHTGPVRALDFNSFRPHIVASGASDSEIFIWDFNNPKTAMSTGTKSQPADDVTHLAWNKQVEHILASTFSTRCVMWDLRKNEPIIKVADTTSRIRYKAVEWHPTVATQMCLASEDDSSPVIQLWDLRFATSPLKVLQGHQRGVLGLAWCQQDPDLLLSCGKDSNIMCWNPNHPYAGYELVCEIPTTTQWSFDVAFCPRNPLVISSSSFDGRVSIFGLSGGTQQPTTSSKLADSFPGMDMTISQAPVPAQKPLTVQLRDAPKWLKRPCGASFAFGGKLIKFENIKNTQGQGAPDQRLVTISQIVTLPEFLARSQKLEAALAAGNLGEFCEEKSNQTTDENEAGIWRYLRASFAHNPAYEYLDMLGFNPNEINGKLASVVGKSDTVDPEVDSLTDGFVSLAQGDSFGNQPQAFDELRKSGGTSPVVCEPLHIQTDEDSEGLLNQALLSGNIEYAVDLCLQEERWPEAFILASCGGPKLTKQVQQKYFKKCKSKTPDMVQIVVAQDWGKLVERCDLKYWQQALATILTHVHDEREFASLAGFLGQRLESSDDINLRKSAMICYVCSGNMDRLADSWTRLIDSEAVDSATSLQNLVEQVTVLRKAAEARGRKESLSTGPLSSRMVEYATLLASQGSLESALKYLSDSTDPTMVTLRERIQYALGYQLHRPAGIGPRSRQSSESSTSYHRSALPQKRPSYTPSVPTFQPAPTLSNGYGGMNYNQPGTFIPQQPQHANQNLPLPPVSSAAHGWNDPPPLSSVSKPKLSSHGQPDALEPITHPIFGTAPAATGPVVGGGDYGSSFSNAPYGQSSYGASAPLPPPTLAPPKPASSAALGYGGPPVPIFPPGGQQQQPNFPASVGPPPSSAYKHGSVSAFASKPPLPPTSAPSFTPALFTPGPTSSGAFPSSGYTQNVGFPGSSFAPPTSNSFTPAAVPSKPFTPGPPPSSGFNPAPPPSSGFMTGPPPSTGYTPGPPPSTGYAPGPPPSSGYAPGPPPSSGFTPGLPPSSGFTPGPPPSSGFTPGPPPSSGFTPGPPPSSGFTPGPPPSSGFAPGLPPLSEFTQGPPPSSTFTPGHPPQNVFNQNPQPLRGLTPRPPSGSGGLPPTAEIHTATSAGPPPSLGFQSGPPPSSRLPSAPPSLAPGPLGGPPSSVSGPPPFSGFTPGASVNTPSSSSVFNPLTSQVTTTFSPTSISNLQGSRPPSTQSPVWSPPTTTFTPNPTVSSPAYAPFPDVSSTAQTSSQGSLNLVPELPSAAVSAASGWGSNQSGHFGEPPVSILDSQEAFAPPAPSSSSISPPPSLQQGFPSPLPSLQPSDPQSTVKPAVEAVAKGSGGPIPEEHKELVEVLEKLRAECYNVAGLPQIKRKLEDVARKLEILHEKLRGEALSASTLTSLHNIVDAMKTRDYQLALSIHTQLVTAGNFAEISSFLPSIKVLIQSAAQLNVFL